MGRALDRPNLDYASRMSPGGRFVLFRLKETRPAATNDNQARDLFFFGSVSQHPPARVHKLEYQSQFPQ